MKEQIQKKASQKPVRPKTVVQKKQSDAPLAALQNHLGNAAVQRLLAQRSGGDGAFDLDDATAGKLKDVVDGYAKSLWSAFGGPAGSVAVNGLLLATYVLPAVAAVAARDARTRRWGRVGYVAGVTSRALVARRTGERVLPDALAQPASIAAFAVLNAISWRRHLSRRNTWKGRPVTMQEAA